MTEIEVVIKIPEEMYKWVNDVNKFSYDYGTSDFIDLVKNGTPLPKGHGRLVDENQIKKCGWNFVEHHAKTDAPTIIEKDDEVES